MVTWSKETFKEKIDLFSGHKRYEALRNEADKAISSYDGFGLGGYVDILEQYPNAEIHNIAESAAKFYIECGYEIINDGKRTLAIKKNEPRSDVDKVMTRDEMITFIKENPNVKIKHECFSPNEYIYSKENGEVYTEEGYLFEDWYIGEFTGHNGIRMRKGNGWETGWSLYKENEDGKTN